ncbi:MAG: hypothetical protein QY306_06205 [Anaerolineales bacterium]|nr:MAG: hypothetical protein QY306_06205 [Anaerolineales bacterium]
MNGKIVLRVVAGLVLLGVIAAIGFLAFQAGVAQGSPITIEAPSGESVPMPYPQYGYGYGVPFRGPHFGFGFGCLIPLFGLFLLVLALKSFRMMMWGPRWGWGGRHGGWGEHGVPPMFEEWYKRAHEPKESNESGG